MNAKTDFTERFSSRVENYGKYRPGYPAEVLSTLKLECGLTHSSTIADIGSGTGMLTKLQGLYWSHQENNSVTFEYRSIMYCGQLPEGSWRCWCSEFSTA